jgi:1,2-diacylglycerol 3-alpha-glucosyltransferase
MKVVLLCEFFGKGLGYLEDTLHHYIVKHGHELTIVASAYENVFDFYAGRHPPAAEATTERFEGAKLVRLPFSFNIANRLVYLKGLGRLLEDERPNAVVALDVMPNLLDVVSYKRRHPGCRFVMHSTMDASNSGRSWLSRMVLHRLIRRSLLNRVRSSLDAVFPVNPQTGDFLHRHYGIGLDEMEVVPLGFDTGGRDHSTVRRDPAVRAELGFAEDDVVLLTGGKLGPLKKTELAIEAVQALPHLPLRLVVVGAPEAGGEAYYARLREQAGEDPRIRFTGWLGDDEIRRLMTAADLAAFPASQSALWILAVAMGLPLVVGDSGGQDASYLNRAGNMIVLPAEEITAAGFARAIEPIVADPRLRARMAAGAAEVAETFLNWDRLIETVLGTGASAQEAC